jgi:hypothetical protein
MGTDMNEPEKQKRKTIELPEDEEPTEEPGKAEPLFAFGGDDDPPRGWKEIGGHRFYLGDGPRWRLSGQ